ncbi:hypothetical protein MIND_00850500 [Mycena indigotica]|uniref:Complex 1 LYR protein domain-containing protein n=1 Tax=Mycena indigotica TaxID=2126181 RepID=A0A8H6SIM3_9AGAR|nr:uncharacterized protein MIND_00850500 [Mycena indigotica]KAF7299022.1 hypothetical protein MIND_00850500 [Mycena indigotica]
MSHSGLQKEVLSLYRRALRIPRSKPEASRSKWNLMLRYTFRTQAARAHPGAFSTIEYLLRAGRRQIDMFEHPSVKDCHVSAEMQSWQTEHKNTSRSQT